jgi:hypothetical protein
MDVAMYNDSSYNVAIISFKVFARPMRLQHVKVILAVQLHAGVGKQLGNRF